VAAELDRDVMDHFGAWYGTEASTVIQFARTAGLTDRLAPGCAILAGEVAYAVEFGAAVHLSDVVLASAAAWQRRPPRQGSADARRRHHGRANELVTGTARGRDRGGRAHLSVEPCAVRHARCAVRVHRALLFEATAAICSTETHVPIQPHLPKRNAPCTRHRARRMAHAHGRLLDRKRLEHPRRPNVNPHDGSRSVTPMSIATVDADGAVREAAADAHH
jgi:hypothetical protein